MKHPIALPPVRPTSARVPVLALGAIVLAGLAPVALALAAPGATAAARGAQESNETSEAPLYYATVAADGAVVRNLMDPKGVEVAALGQADVVAVHEEAAAGWLAVEVPEGFAAYVFGRFLEPTEVDGVYRVTRNAVNIRPRPSSDVQSFPLPQRLHAGDQVAVIGQADPSKAWAEDWIRIWTPPGVRAFVRAEHVQQLDATPGAAAWAKASAGIAASRRELLLRDGAGPRGTSAGGGDVAAPADASAPIGAEPTGAATTTAAAPGESAANASMRDDLARVRRRVEAEQTKATPDFRSLQDELAVLLRDAGDPGLKEEVALELDRVTALAEAVALSSELQRMKEAQDQETARVQKEIWEEGRRLDPLRRAFDVHGVLVRRIDGDGTPRYTVEVRREVVAELLCTSGRYDLDAFSGYEIGLQGRPIVAEAAAPKGQAEPMPVVDVTRIVVLKRR